MANQEELRAIIRGHANRHDIYNHDAKDEFTKIELAFRALQEYGDDLLPALLDALMWGSSVAVREIAMSFLWEMDTDDESVLPAMLRALEDSNKRIRHRSAGFVTRYGEQARGAIPTFQSWIASIDEMSRIIAAGCILRIDKSQTDAMVSILINAALASDGWEQWRAILELDSLGETALPAVPALERLMNEGDTTICWQSSDALYRITGNPDYVIKAGRRLLDDPDELERYVGVEHLMQLGKSVIPMLEKVAVEDESDMVRNRAKSALREIEGGEQCLHRHEIK